MCGPGKQAVHFDKRNVSPPSLAFPSLLMTYRLDIGACARRLSSHNSLGKLAKGGRGETVMSSCSQYPAEQGVCARLCFQHPAVQDFCDPSRNSCKGPPNWGQFLSCPAHFYLSTYLISMVWVFAI